MKLENKVIVVTGGSVLLGRSFIEKIKLEGGIAINADIHAANDLERGEIHLDITQEESVKLAIEKVVSNYGRIDGWVNNAYPRTKDWGTNIETLELASWRQNVDMHMNGYFCCCREVLLQMKKQGFGSVVNLSSIYGINGPDFTVYEGTAIGNAVEYSAIKGGIVNLTKYLASYFGKDGCRVNCVSPGGIFDHQDERFVANYNKKVPLKRMGNPADIAPSISFLLSDEANYITGHNLIVDGGWSIV
jgi:NAD(P)-dependent dehydrogenase (short-subunit alcohol dehydrogenase family)